MNQIPDGRYLNPKQNIYKMVDVGPSSAERVLYLDFSKLVKYNEYGIMFSVEYLKQQVFEPEYQAQSAEPTNDASLAGKAEIFEGKPYCDAVRLRAIINRAIDAKWVTSSYNFVWRFCLFNKNFRVIKGGDSFVFYELMPGTNFGGVLIKSDDHVKEIIRLSMKGYYVTHNIHVTEGMKMVSGQLFDDNIILVPDRFYQDL